MAEINEFKGSILPHLQVSFTTNTVLLGDFNIDAAKKYETDYRNKDLFDDFDLALGDFDLNQMISFETWSRVINNVRKFSTLDHLYCKDPTFLEDKAFINPLFGDHVVIT